MSNADDSIVLGSDEEDEDTVVAIVEGRSSEDLRNDKIIDVDEITCGGFDEGEEAMREDEEDNFILSESEEINFPSSNKPKRRGSGSAVKKWLSRTLRKAVSSSSFVKDLKVVERNEYALTDHNFETEGDLKICPMCIEALDSRNEGRSRRNLYLLPRPGGHGIGPTGEWSLRSYSEIVQGLSMAPIPKLHKNKKFSENEKRRRCIIESYKATLETDAKRLQDFLLPYTQNDEYFLGSEPRRFSLSSSRSVVDDSSNRQGLTGVVAMALSRRHWREMYLQIERGFVLVYSNRDDSRPYLSIRLDTILSVRALSPNESPTHSYYFFEIETFPRVFYFLVKTERSLRTWLGGFATIFGRNQDIYSNGLSEPDQMYSPIYPSLSGQNSPLQNIDLDDVYLARPKDWRMKKRRVFNYRRTLFRSCLATSTSMISINDRHGMSWESNGVSGNSSGSSSSRDSSLSPTVLIESILKMAIDLCDIQDCIHDGLEKDGVVFKWIAFFDLVSMLQVVDLTQLGEKEKTAAFLNLYHVMILHGTMVLGPPTSLLAWPSFFNSVSYLIGFESVTLAELEHCIIRGASAGPSPRLSKTIIPTASFPSLELQSKDFRISFCLNCGSMSYPNQVPVFKAMYLDQQFDAMTRLFLESVTVDENTCSVQIPLVCLWYAQDFVPQMAAGRGSQPQDSVDSCVLRVLSYYLPTLMKDRLRKFFSRMTGIDKPSPEKVNVVYQPFSYRCQSKPFTEMRSEVYL